MAEALLRVASVEEDFQAQVGVHLVRLHDESDAEQLAIEVPMRVQRFEAGDAVAVAIARRPAHARAQFSDEVGRARAAGTYVANARLLRRHGASAFAVYGGLKMQLGASLASALQHPGDDGASTFAMRLRPQA